eukprot:gene5458-7554_t
MKFHLLRQVRIQLKNGFMKEEPSAYRHMKKYPILSRDTKPSLHKIEKKRIPYVGLYEKAIEKNPLFEDEKIYPAYWQHEPLALRLAKKQYELMTSGMSEDEAYKVAMNYVHELESKDYEKILDLHEMLRKDGIKVSSIANDSSLSADVEHWRNILQETPYESLELADQGEIDHLIQTRILKWNEVERERRMKDPIFCMEFDKIRNIIFPPSDKAIDEKHAAFREEFKTDFFPTHGLVRSKFSAKDPFFLEDYVFYYNKAKATPYLNRWHDSERRYFSAWIFNSLAMGELVDNKPVEEVHRYLEELRSHFFPMLKFPAQNDSFPTFTVQDLKNLLYDNDVGYKNDRGKVYVKRYYKLPILLFPSEIFITTPVTSETKLRSFVEDQSGIYLAKDMEQAGMSEANFAQTTKTLANYAQRYAKNDSSSAIPGEGLTMSLIDSLIFESGNDKPKIAVKKDDEDDDEPRTVVDHYKTINYQISDLLDDYNQTKRINSKKIIKDLNVLLGQIDKFIQYADSGVSKLLKENVPVIVEPFSLLRETINRYFEFGYLPEDSDDVKRELKSLSEKIDQIFDEMEDKDDDDDDDVKVDDDENELLSRFIKDEKIDDPLSLAKDLMEIGQLLENASTEDVPSEQAKLLYLISQFEVVREKIKKIFCTQDDNFKYEDVVLVVKGIKVVHHKMENMSKDLIEMIELMSIGESVVKDLRKLLKSIVSTRITNNSYSKSDLNLADELGLIKVEINKLLFKKENVNEELLELDEQIDFHLQELLQPTDNDQVKNQEREKYLKELNDYFIKQNVDNINVIHTDFSLYVLSNVLSSFIEDHTAASDETRSLFEKIQLLHRKIAETLHMKISTADDTSSDRQRDVVSLDGQADNSKPLLERARNNWFKRFEYVERPDPENELRLKLFEQNRLEAEIVVQARLGSLYENKEAARRLREWRRKGTWLEKMPRAELAV